MNYFTGEFDLNSIELTTSSSKTNDWDYYTYPCNNWPYGYIYIPSTEPAFKVLNLIGKTIIYALLDNQIKYAVVQPGKEVSFKYTESLEELLRLFV